MQAAMELAERDSSNPYHQAKYSSLSAAWKACRGPMTANGLALVQVPSVEGGRAVTTSLLVHKSGEWIRGELALPVVNQTPQAFGSGFSYGRRYMMVGLLGIASGDDDGELAEGRRKGDTKESLKARQQEIAHDKIAAMKKAVPPPIPGDSQRAAEEALNVGPQDVMHAMSLEDRLEASVKQVRSQNVSRRKHDSVFDDMLSSFAHAKKELEAIGRVDIYYDVLAGAGVKHSNEFQHMEGARATYRILAARLSEAKGMIDAQAEETAAMRES